MLKIALTGGIATGKSYVLARLRDRGIPTIDADDIVHEALGPETITTNAVALQLGTALLKPDGSIDRALLGEKVFADADARRRLEAIVHPHVYETIRRWFERDDRPLGVASIPLLYETHHEQDFDAVIVTACKAEQQLQRVIERGLSAEDARRRMAAQIPTEEKATCADFVIWTSGTTLETDRQVDELMIKLGGVASRESSVDSQ
jgi:dephospho-CoA kinase